MTLSLETRNKEFSFTFLLHYFILSRESSGFTFKFSFLREGFYAMYNYSVPSTSSIFTLQTRSRFQNKVSPPQIVREEKISTFTNLTFNQTDNLSFQPRQQFIFCVHEIFS